jgi:hypothetical protein
MTRRSPLDGWSREQIAQGKRWVDVWRQAGPRLEHLRREELKRVDPYQAIALLCGPADYRSPPRVARPSSGLIEQQRLFGKLRPA